MEPDEKPGDQAGGISISGDNITIHGDVVGRDKTVYNLYSGSPPRVRDENQLKLMGNVKADWIEGVLKKSVYAETMIQLGKQIEPDAIEHPWKTVLDTQDRHREPVPPGKKVGKIFEEVQNALLILGEPGSGKTITLLELARDLIARVEEDAKNPVPVVLNLSSWQAKDKEFGEWVVRELNLKYRVNPGLAHNWIKSFDLVLLLDGLDEVAPPLRAKCAESINRFLLEGQFGIAICCRRADYEALAVRLNLRGAISLQPLTTQQVDEFVAKAGEGLSGLRTALQQAASLRDLAQSPLMLSVMMLAYQDTSAHDLIGDQPTSSNERRTNIFTTYVDQMFRRRKPHLKDARAIIVKGLEWLAEKMAQHNQSQFLIENLQPSWLARPANRWLYAISSRLAAALVIAFAFMALLVGPLVRLSVDLSFVANLLLVPLVGCIGTGLLLGEPDLWRFAENDQRRQADDVSKSKVRYAISTWLQAAFYFAFTYVVLGLLGLPIVSWALVLVHSVQNIAPGIWGFVVVAIVIALPFGLIVGPRKQWSTPQLDIRGVESLTWSWKRFFAPLLVCGVLLGGLTLLITTLMWNPGSKLLSENGRRICYLKGTRPRFNSDGTRITTAHDNGIMLWNGEDGALIAEMWASPDSYPAEFSPDGRLLSLPGGSTGLELLNSQTGRRISTITPDGDDQGSLLFSPDSTRILTATVDHRAIGHWDPRTGDPIDNTGIGGLWDTSTGKLLNSFSLRWSSLGPSFNRDSTRFATVGENNRCQLWNAADGTLIANLGAVDHQPRFTPDGNRILTLDGRGLLRLWNAEDGALVGNLEDQVKYLAILSLLSAHARIITVTMDGTERLRDAHLGAVISSLETPPVSLTEHFGAQLNEQGTRILQTSEDGGVLLWDATTGRRIAVRESGQSSLHRFSPDGSRFTTVNKDGVVKLWNAANGGFVAFLDPGKEHGSISETVDESYPIFSPDGSRIITVQQDGKATLWTSLTGAAIVALEAHLTHTKDGEDLSERTPFFSPDGNRITAISEDGTARFWDGNTGKLLSTTVSPVLPGTLRFSANSKRVLVLSAHAETADHRAVSLLWLPAGLLLGLLMGLRPTMRETKNHPNEGMWLTAKNSAGVGLAWGSMLAVVGVIVLIFIKATFLVGEKSVPLSKYLWSNMPIILGFFVFCSTLAALSYGGLDFIQHFVLRIILHFESRLPWRYSRLFDQAADRVLLRRVGAGYIFIHRLLLNHFAGLDVIPRS